MQPRRETKVRMAAGEHVSQRYVCARKRTKLSERSWRSHGHPLHAIRGRLGGASHEITWGRREGQALASKEQRGAGVSEGLRLRPTPCAEGETISVAIVSNEAVRKMQTDSNPTPHLRIVGAGQ